MSDRDMYPAILSVIQKIFFIIESLNPQTHTHVRCQICLQHDYITHSGMIDMSLTEKLDIENYNVI